MIQEKLYNWDDEVSSNAVEVHIHHLRRKLGNGFIRTIHGVGYTLGMRREASQPAAAFDLIFSLLALMTWCTASVVAWVMSRNTINEVFDTQQMLFAKRLATANLGDLLADESARSLPKPRSWCIMASVAIRTTTRWRSPSSIAKARCCSTTARMAPISCLTGSVKVLPTASAKVMTTAGACCG